MNVIISSRHMEVTPAIKQHAQEKVVKLSRYYDRIQEIEVVVDVEEKNKRTVSVEVIVNGEHKNMFIAREKGTDLYHCIDGCVDKLERQLSDHHKQVKNRKHPE